MAEMSFRKAMEKIRPDSHSRIGWTCAVIFIGSWNLFLIGITRPGTLYWDEVNYIPAARSLLSV